MPKPPQSWGKSTVTTACPLDCPDACSLAVHVENGKIVSIDGDGRNPATQDYICAKVRNFPERVYSDLRVEYPRVRIGRKGAGAFKRVSWEEALALVADRLKDVRDRWGGQAILPFYYGGSNGWVTQELSDADLFRRLGASRLARTVCAAPSTAAATAMYGKMPGVAYQDYEHARLIVVWGANPSASGIHLVPFIKRARARGTTVVVVDPRRTPLARVADVHLPVRPGTDLPLALALIRLVFERGAADRTFIDAHTTGADRLRERASEWPVDRAATVCGLAPSAIERLADLYIASSPAVIRCGWGLERNRNGGNAVLAVLALPAVAGKFGVRGGGYTMSNSAAYGLSPTQWAATPEPATRVVNMNHLGRVLTEQPDPSVRFLFVYNCNPAVTVPDQHRVLAGLEREDLFTVVFDQVMTDTAAYADVVLPATTFLEGYDTAKGYGAYSLLMVKPAIDAVGESRPNNEVFSDIATRLGLADGVETDAEGLMRVASRLPDPVRARLMGEGSVAPPDGVTPVQFVDTFPRTPERKARLFPEECEKESPLGAYRWQPDPASEQYPLTLITPASEKTVSSTLGEMRRGPASLYMHPQDAAPRGITDGDTVRVFNAQGEFHCVATVGDLIVAGTVSIPKGLWRKSTLNNVSPTALVPDSLTDLGGGACFNDARVDVAVIVTAELGSERLAMWVGPESPRTH